jgi:predicted nucleic acid-binding protein
VTAVFADTSALYAVLDADDANHPAAAAQWRRLLQGHLPLSTTSYVLVETAALVQHRLGLEALSVLDQDIVPILHVEWVGQALHAAAMSSVLTVRRRDLSLVDCVSFAAMRERGLSTVFAFDAHFAQQGFRCVPGGDESTSLPGPG